MKRFIPIVLLFFCVRLLSANDFMDKVYEVRKGPEGYEDLEFLFSDDSLLICDMGKDIYSQYSYDVVGGTIYLGESQNPGSFDYLLSETIPYSLKDGTAVLELSLDSGILTLYDSGRKEYRSNLAFSIFDKAAVATALIAGTVHANQNVSYERNGYQYEKDRNGNIVEAKGELRLEESVRNKTAQRLAGGENRLPTDDGGHLVANRFGGSGELDNLVAMDRTLNRGEWKVMENSWERALVEGNDVSFIIKPKYWYSSRPYAFKVIDYIGEQRHVYRFSN